MKIVKSTNVFLGIPNPGDVWAFKFQGMESHQNLSKTRIFMRISDEVGEKHFYGHSNGDMYSIAFDNGEIFKSDINRPMEIYAHAELRL